jgi:hypothetical protein
LKFKPLKIEILVFSSSALSITPHDSITSLLANSLNLQIWLGRASFPNRWAMSGSNNSVHALASSYNSSKLRMIIPRLFKHITNIAFKFLYKLFNVLR